MTSVPGKITAAITEFTSTVGFDDIPPHVIERAKVHILDTLGLCLAGSLTEAATVARDILPTTAPANVGSTIFGTHLRAAPRFAALANAVAAHAHNFDDTTPQVQADRTGGIHASGAILPVGLALGEEYRASGKEIITSYLIGVEVASRLNHTIAPRHYADGFHATATLNGFGGACAAARLMKLPPKEIFAAVSIAASQSGGVRRNFGSSAEIFHSGWAAENGVVAADLARRGISGANDALEGPSGFFEAAGGGFDPNELIGKLGKPWIFEHPGVWIKQYPNGALTHPAADSLLGLIENHSVNRDEITRIVVKTNERIWNTLQHHEPKTGMQAKFSMEFILGAIIVDGSVGLDTFTDSMVADREVRHAMTKVDYAPFAKPPTDFSNVTTLLEVHLRDGRRLSSRADHALGSTEAPLSYEQVADKFSRCATFVGHAKEKIKLLVTQVADLENAESPEKLVNALISNN